MLFLTPLFASLPESELAALIIHALWHIIALRKLYKLRPWLFMHQRCAFLALVEPLKSAYTRM
jgi:MFS superfamily sulfate permease-like transporter